MRSVRPPRAAGAVVALVHLVLCATACAAPSFRFAWLSDTHVGSSTGAADLRRSVHDLNASVDLAFVLVSGDVTEMGTDAEIVEARAILDSLRHPWHVIPGNHDTKWSESGGTSFGRIFGSDRFCFENQGIVLLGLHQGPLMRMGDGHFAPEDLRWLDSALASIPAGAPLFFVTHYPLDPSVDNWYEVTGRLRRRNVLAILHGHGHANRAAVFDGIPGVMSRSNLRARAETGGYTTVEVRGDSVFFSEKRPGEPPLPPWHLLTTETRRSASLRPADPRPDFSLNNTPGTPVERWSFNAGASVTSSAAASGELCVVADALGRVRALSLSDGMVRWTHQAGGPVHGTPAIAGERVLVGSADGTVACLELRSGRLLWSARARGPVLASPVVEGEKVFVGASDGAFRAFALESGTLLWEFAGVGGFVETRPLVMDGRVVFGAWDGNLYALDAADGRLLWTWSNGTANRLLSPAACHPVGAAGKIFIVAPDRFMTAVDAATGRTVWRTNRFQVREAIGLTADRRSVVVRTMRDTVAALATEPDTAAVHWITNAGFGYDIAPAMPAEHGGEVVVGTKNGLVLGLDREDGRVRWRRKIGVTVVATPAVLPDGLLLSDLDGRIVLLQPKDAKQ